MSKNKNHRANLAALTRALLVERYPACFAAKGEDKRPLALGIDKQIIGDMPEIGFVRLAAALTDYTNGPTYLRNVVEGAARVGLDGEAHGFVTASEAAHAAHRLANLETWLRSERARTKTAAEIVSEQVP